jgi:membrane-associated protease RseP (regulator of RpoE activity)
LGEQDVDAYLGYWIAGAAVLVYFAVVYALWRSGFVGADRPVAFLGPALMFRTKRGRALLDRWGRFLRFWTRAGDLAIALAAIAMAVIVALLVLGAIVSLRLTPATAPSLTEEVGLPGINPVIPLGYGIVALVIGVVLHEVCHGIVARSQRIGVKSLGILFFVVPVGAFVEQDDAEMNAAPRRHRDRVAAAGVFANFVLALIFFAALSGVVSASVHPNAAGVAIAGVLPNTPAAGASLAAGDIVTGVNGTATPTVATFEAVLAGTVPNETVNLTYYAAASGANVNTTVKLASDPTVPTRGFLGVEVLFLTPAQLKQTLVWPASNGEGPIDGTLDWFFLPLATIEPVGGAATGYFHVGGPFASLGTEAFWIGANLLFWLAWMNLLLGLSNALPLIPLDGGLLFRDFAASIAARFRSGWNAARLDEFGGKAAVASSLVVLFLLLWQVVVPHLL